MEDIKTFTNNLLKCSNYFNKKINSFEFQNLYSKIKTYEKILIMKKKYLILNRMLLLKDNSKFIISFDESKFYVNINEKLQQVPKSIEDFKDKMIVDSIYDEFLYELKKTNNILPIIFEDSKQNKVSLIMHNIKGNLILYLIPQNIKNDTIDKLNTFCDIMNNNLQNEKIGIFLRFFKENIKDISLQNPYLLTFFYILVKNTKSNSNIGLIITQIEEILNNIYNSKNFLSYMNFKFCKKYLPEDIDKDEGIKFLVNDYLFEWRQTIDSVLDKYKRLYSQIPKNEKVEIPYSFKKDNKIINYKIPYENYIKEMIGFIFQEEFISKDLINYFYKKNISNFKNILKVVIDQYRKNIIIFTNKQESYLYNSSSINYIYQIIEENINRDNFFILEVIFHPDDEKTSHYNIALIEKITNIKNETKYLLNYYEPHGNKPYSIISNFLENLVNISYNKIIINFSSNEIGSQSYTKEQVGFCISFSLFWIHIVLKIIKINLENCTYITTDNWISKLEKYYINKLNKDELYKIILVFISNLFNNFIAEKSKSYIENFDKQFYNHLLKSQKSILVNETKDNNEENNNIISYKEQKRFNKEEFEKAREKSPEITYEDWEIERKKEIQEYKDANIYLNNLELFNYWKTYINKKGYKIENGKIKLGKLLGSNCIEDNDCFSKKCKIDEEGNYCIP